ncbi:hypothetical protein LTR12_003190 [Friedmanniomyces endolithicus]|nr:hypothetical protein LTR12_003190 [Friedmanniomyces endolithicus]
MDTPCIAPILLDGVPKPGPATTSGSNGISGNGSLLEPQLSEQTAAARTLSSGIKLGLVPNNSGT